MQKKLLAAGVALAAITAAAVAESIPPQIAGALALGVLVVGLAFLPLKLSRLQLGIMAFCAIAGATAILFGYSWVDVGAGLALANAPGGVEMKQIEEAINKATAAVKSTTDRMQQALDQAIAECKRLETVTGKTNDELKTASDLAAKSQTELKGVMDRVLEVEQKLAKRPSGGESERKSWGQIATESEQFKSAKGRAGKGGMEPVEVGSWHKTAIQSSNLQTTGNISMVPAERVSFIAPAERQLMVRRLLPVMSTESNMIEFWKENVFTNNAAPQGAGSSPAETEFQLKAESGITFTFVQVGLTTIAHWIPVSRQALSDAKMLASYIDQRLRYGVLLEEEDEVLNSTGANGELNGLINQATAYNRRATADSRLDTLLKAFLQVTLSDYAADGVVMSNVDWTEILLLKDTQGRYLFGDPSAAQQDPRVWGRPCIPTNSIATGDFLTGAFQLSAALWDREQATVRVAEQHADFFVRNAVCLLAEERVALTVYRPSGLVAGDFGAAAGQPG
jgi:HK97 family phage major capsid protein